MLKTSKIVIITISFLLLLGAILLLIFGKNEKPSAVNYNQNQSRINLFTIPDSTSAKMTLKSDGEEIEVNNLYSSPVEKLSQDAIVFSRSTDFDVSFYPQDQGFIITLIGADLNLARAQAENDFLEKLGITKKQACKLKVHLSVPAFVNSDLAGSNYGLSFCPDGKPFTEK